MDIMKKHFLAIIMALAMPSNASNSTFKIAQSKKMKVVNMMNKFLESTNDLYYSEEINCNNNVDQCWNNYHAKPNTTFTLR